MNIGLYTDSMKLPNLALMKLSKYHKLKKDNVSFYQPIFANEYDKVYYSKIFNFSKTQFDIPNAEIGGSGYNISKQLPNEIDNLEPDYSIYPDIDYTIGFITRGCIRDCSWCVVPKKEGYIKPYRTVEQIARTSNDNLLLLDNNILASDFGISEIEKLSKTNHKVDFNQGLDARLVTPEIAKLLSMVKWIKYIRFSCDTKPMIKYVRNAVELLNHYGLKKRIFIYVLGVNFEQAYLTIEELKSIDKKIITFLQPIRSINSISQPDKLLSQLANWNNREGFSKGMSFALFMKLRNNTIMLSNEQKDLIGYYKSENFYKFKDYTNMNYLDQLKRG